jgi:pyruvate,orthophosphate dikinase
MIGLNYVSCSPFRVPIARLAAAQAALRHPANAPSAKVVKDTKGAKGATKSKTVSKR